MASARHYWGIDLVRFGAALLVSSFHLAYWSWYSPKDTAALASGGFAQFPELAAWTWFGWVGVEIFFVISGVVIAFSAARATPREFAFGRISRLYPAAWVCASMSLAVALLIDLAPVGQLAAAYLSSIVLFPIGPWIDGVYWTLAVEIVFYLLVFAVLHFSSYGRLELIMWWVGGASALFWIVQIVADIPVGPDVANLSLLRHGAFFALGVTMLTIATQGVSLVRIGATACLLAVCLLEIVSLGRARGPTPTAFLAPCIVWCASVVAIASSLSFGKHVALTPNKQAFVRQLGLMTYPLYLLHGLVGCAVLRATPFIGRWGALALSLAVSIAIAWLVVRVESPLRRALNGALNRVPASAKG